jgi:hypothetical protein
MAHDSLDQSPPSAPVKSTGRIVSRHFQLCGWKTRIVTRADAAAFARRRNAGFAIIYCGWPGPRWLTNAYRAAFDRQKGWAAEHHVHLIDTSPYLAARPVSEVFQDGMHLRAAGNALMAHAIENHPRQLGPGAALLLASSRVEMRP